MLASYSMFCCDGPALGTCDGLSVGDFFQLCETLGLVVGVWVRASSVGERVGLLLGDDDSEHGRVVADLVDFLVPLADLSSPDFDPLDEDFSLLLVDWLEPEVDLLHDFKVVDFDVDLD